MYPWLSQEEIDDLCKPLIQHAAQIRFIKRLGIKVEEKPNGAPLVLRSNLEESQSPGRNKKPSKPVPDMAGLRLAWSRR